MPSGAKRGLKERLSNGEYVLAAEGYLFEFERRGYLRAGPFTPEVVIDHPELVEQLSEEFVHAGSDVVLAFTYYGHREKMRLVGREDELENLNRKALQIAKKVADRNGVLMAGNVCNTTCYDPNDPKTHEQAMAMFKEEVEWAVQEGADFMLGETFSDFNEAKLALDAIKKYGNGMPAVMNLAPNTSHLTRDGMKYEHALKQLEDLGADVVGLNCSFGPKTIIEEMRKVRAVCKGPLACLPVPYRTTPDMAQFQALLLPESGKRAFPDNLDYYCSTVDDIYEFGQACKELNIQYAGICCGNSSRYFRRLAESLGRTPPASKYSPNMSLHYVYGDQKHFAKANTETLRKLNTPKEN